YSAAKAAEEIYQAFKNSDIKHLKKISINCAESMATENEEGVFSLSVISYVLGKLLEKPRYFRDNKHEDLSSFIQTKLSLCAKYSKEGRKEDFSRETAELLSHLGEFDQKHRHYVIGLIDKAKLKIAARLYAQGFSLSYVVSITGADTREVLKYIGQTLMFDRVGKTKEVKERLENARRIFG
ncbi:MAG: hypothetical protein V1909_01595, partial [Candidatus Micrarchaeota archaeon]